MLPIGCDDARRSVVAGCQASRSPKSILRGCPQIVRAGGLERLLFGAQVIAEVKAAAKTIAAKTGQAGFAEMATQNTGS